MFSTLSPTTAKRSSSRGPATNLPSSFRYDRTAGSSRRVNQLIRDVIRNGNDGIGKPEPLKHGFQGYWSRRINDEHRLVYKVIDDEVRIAACRYHYEA